MKIPALALLVLALLGQPVRADMYQDASNARLPGARTNLGGAYPVSIMDYGARGDVITLSDGVIAAGGTTLTSATAAFSQGDVGKKIQVDGGNGVWLPPLATTISAVSSADTVTLAAPATVATPRYYYASATVATPRAAGNYRPGDVLTLQGGTSAVQGQATVSSTYVTASAITAGGSGGADGGCIVQGTTGAGTKFRQNVTITGGAITSLGAFAGTNGTYFTNPTSLAAEPVSNAPGFTCAPTGATLILTMGVGIAYVSTRGDYSVPPANPVATGTASLSGATGATLNVTFNPTGAIVYGTDDSLALKQAIDAAAAQFAQGRQSYVFVPAGNYLIDSTPTPVMYSGLGIIGEGMQKTNFVLGANYAGDLFAWSEAWQAGSSHINGTVSMVSNVRSGAKAKHFSVWGNRTAAAQQNALVFYNRNDAVGIDDISVNYLNGRCLYSGVMNGVTQAYMRESRIGKLICSVIGSPTAPAIEFASEGDGDATDEISIQEIDVYAPYGHGVVIRNNAPNDGLRALRINKLRIEGLQWGSSPGDLLRIGDPVMSGQIHDIYINQLELLSPYPNTAALRITAPNQDANPYFIRVESGVIGGGLPQGYGLVMEAGRNMQFDFQDIYTWNTNVTMSAIAGGNMIDGHGTERNWTYAVADARGLSTPLHKVGLTMPVSCTGLQSGTLWNDAGTVKVCP